MQRRDSNTGSVRARLWAGPIIWFVTMIWFLVLAQWLWVTPGSTVTQRSNTLFHSDAAHSIQRLTAEKMPELRTFEYWVHPWAVHLWRPLTRTGAGWLATFMPTESASVWAAKLLVSSIAALGAAGLGILAIARGVPSGHLTIGLALYLMFSSNVIVVLPEHFGISHGLLAATYSAWQLITGTLAAGIAIAVLGFLTLGTTITNATFPAVLLAALPFKAQRLKVLTVWVLLAVSLVLLLAVATTDFGTNTLIPSVFDEDTNEVHRFVGKFQNNRWTRDPAAAGRYALSAFTLPVIGPRPHLVKVYKGKFDMLSFEPLTWGDYNLLQVIGMGAWVTLLIISTVQALRRRDSATAALILLAWILFNAVFHNFWGDEFFLFSPHWSWALVALLLAGIRDVPFKLLAGLALAIGLAQAQSLWLIRTTLETIL